MRFMVPFYSLDKFYKYPADQKCWTSEETQNLGHNWDGPGDD